MFVYDLFFYRQVMNQPTANSSYLCAVDTKKATDPKISRFSKQEDDVLCNILTETHDNGCNLVHRLPTLSRRLRMC